MKCGQLYRFKPTSCHSDRTFPDSFVLAVWIRWRGILLPPLMKQRNREPDRVTQKNEFAYRLVSLILTDSSNNRPAYSLMWVEVRCRFLILSLF